MVEVKQIESGNRKASFLIKGIDSALINSVRRTIMVDVNKLAVDTLTIYENSSVMFDEMLAHRLGMVPFKTDLKSYKKGDKIKLLLEKDGPCTVYSKDIISTDPKIEAADKKIPLVKLEENQRIKLELEALMDSGSRHSKYQPAIVSFRQLPVISTEKDPTGANEIIKSSSPGLLEIKAKKVIVADATAKNRFGDIEKAGKKLGLKLEYEKNSYVLDLESDGSLTNEEILLESLKMLNEKTDEFRQAVKDL